jgi:hypothetical protein
MLGPFDFMHAKQSETLCYYFQYMQLIFSDIIPQMQKRLQNLR